MEWKIRLLHCKLALWVHCNSNWRQWWLCNSVSVTVAFGASLIYEWWTNSVICDERCVSFSPKLGLVIEGPRNLSCECNPCAASTKGSQFIQCVFSKSIKTDINVLLAWLNTSSLVSIAQLKFIKVLQPNKPSKPKYLIHWELCWLKWHNNRTATDILSAVWTGLDHYCCAHNATQGTLVGHSLVKFDIESVKKFQ